MTPPRFTVVMNLYNGAAYLDAAIASVLAQTYDDWELILWDDCSTDGSAELCAAWVARDRRIRLHVAAANVGLGASRNRTIAIAQGDWVAFLDQDDLWTPDMLAKQASLIDADTTGRLALVYGRAERFNTEGVVGPFDPWYGGGKLPEGDIFEALLARPSFVPMSTSTFRRDVVQALCPVPEFIRFCTDYWLCCMISRDFLAAAVQTTCCRYRVHEASMTFVYRRQIHEEILYTIAAAARPAHRRLVGRRRRVHETLIGVEEFRAGHRGRAMMHIIRHGSPLYLLLRPGVIVARRLREKLRAASA